MTTTVSQAFLGRVNKSIAQQYRSALKDEGIELLIERNDPMASQPNKVNVYVVKGDYTKAVELIKNFEIRVLIRSEENRKRKERKIMTAFFIFVCVFIIYIVATNI